MTFKRQIVVAAWVILLSTLAVYVVLSILPKTYQSKEVLYFPLAQGGITPSGLAALGGASAVGDVSVGLAGDSISPLVGSSPGTATGILKSRSCLKSVVNTLALDERWGLNQEGAISKLRGQIAVRTDENGFLTLTADSESPELCVDIVESMHAFLIERADELTFNVGRRNRQYVAQRLVDSEVAVDEDEEEFIRVASEHGITDIASVQKLYLDALGAASIAKAEADSAETRIKELEALVSTRLSESNGLSGQLDALQTIEGSSQSTLGEALSSLAMQLQQRTLSLQDVSQRFTESSSEYRRAAKLVQSSESMADSLIADAKKSLAAGTLPGVAEARLSLLSLQATVGSLERTLDDYRRLLVDTPAASAAIERASSKYKASLDRTSMLHAQLEMARIKEQNDPARFELLDPPELVDKAIAPRKMFLTGVWLLAISAVCVWWLARQKLQFVD